MIVACPGCQIRYDLTGRRVGSTVRCRCGARLRVPQPGNEADRLACPTCGAIVANDATACAYCHSELATVACPVCLGRVFAGAPHCTHCGAAVTLGARVPDDVDHVLSCPRCRAGAGHPLVARLLGDVLLEECMACGGVWADAQTFARILKERDEHPNGPDLGLTQVTIELDSPSNSRATASSGRHYIPCPVCTQLMNQKNFGEISGIIIDLCKPHGLWFDKNELGGVVQFVARGGLDEARRRERERLQRDLRAAHAAVAAAPILTSAETHGGEDLWDALRHLAHFFR